MIMFYLEVIDWRTPYYMKLPKDHQFYKHFMQSLKQKRLRDAAKTKVNDDRELFNGARDRILADMARAHAQSSPIGKVKRIPYE